MLWAVQWLQGNNPYCRFPSSPCTPKSVCHKAIVPGAWSATPSFTHAQSSSGCSDSIVPRGHNGHSTRHAQHSTLHTALYATARRPCRPALNPGSLAR
mmetsp:Transcript_133439/g.231481  ORF Transcript_133439/g.231481 Transcript_133439/m.231481 type:complete len:98 (+) Transcript_133439:110-403(+)